MNQTESIGKIPNLKSQKNTLKQPSQPKRHCTCGAEIAAIIFGNITHWPKLCADCDKAKTIRQRHREKAIRLRKQLENRLPRRFWEAHLRDLPNKLIEKIRDLPSDKGLLLFGPPGRGKSHILCALMRDYLLKGYWVIRKTYDELCLDIRDSYDRQELTEKEIVQRYQNADVLMIEDLGTTVGTGNQESDFSVRILMLILDYRIEQCKPTHFTSNKSPDELGRSFDERVASRLYQVCEVVPITGKDKRKKC